MRHLLREWGRLKIKLAYRYLMLFLDYDGTLTPIVEAPHKAVLSDTRRALLDKLSKTARCKLAIISGRSLKDIKKMVGVKNITYSGNHGLEISGPKLKFESRVSADYKLLINRLGDCLHKELSLIKGVLVENKGLTLSVHYRLVAQGHIGRVRRVFYKITRPYLDNKKIRVRPGKKVLEIRPGTEWDKGKVVLWLLARSWFSAQDSFPVYIGDDATDEDAFKALGGRGVTVFVGKKKKSSAGYYLTDSAEVFLFLRRILRLKQSKLCLN